MLGKELQIGRMLIGKTQRQVAAEVGMPVTELCKIERGHYLPNAALEAQLKTACGWSETLSLFVKALSAPSGTNEGLSSLCTPETEHVA